MSASRPGRSSPLVNTRYLLYRRMGGPQGRSRHVRNISPPTGFDPLIVQPVASRKMTALPGPQKRYDVAINIEIRSVS